jgi:O-antigen/teichoic acid export membrane protein
MCFRRGLCAVLHAIFAGKPILTLLYKPEYAERNDVFIILMLSAGINFISSIFGYGMTAARYLKIQVPMCGIALLVVVIMSWWLIPQYGLRGAAWAQVCASAVPLVGAFAINLWAIRKMPEPKAVNET